MERTMWTDERLTDRFDGLDRRLDRIECDIRDLRMLMFQLWGVNMLGIITTIVAVIITNS
jgi:hypothetical protein